MREMIDGGKRVKDVFKVYRVTQDDLERFETLDKSDLGKPYILVQGSMQFVSVGPKCKRYEIVTWL